MLKLILISIYGKKVLSTRALFNSIKSYLIFYMMLLPAFMNARDLKEDPRGLAGNTVDVLQLEASTFQSPEITVASRDLQGAFLNSR